jgi:II/X family phage/plasmid replication protein
VIDWLKLRVPVPAVGRIPGDVVCIFTPEGELKWQKVKAAELRGSYESNVHVSACPVTGSLVIDGNPVKFFQGHNVFGTDDVQGLAWAIINTVASALSFDLANIETSDVDVARIDINRSFGCGSLDNARGAVRALGENATMRHRGRGQLTREGTAYWGKHSRREALKAYAKGHELIDHPIAKDHPMRCELVTYAQQLLRIELVLRSMSLKDRGLSILSRWTDSIVDMLFREAMGKLTVPDNIELAPTTLEGLSPRLRLAYSAWLRGDDLRATLPRMTFYRYRKELLKVGVDLLSLRASEPRRPTLQLVNVINAVPVSVPEWAVGTVAYFDPRRAA